MTSGLDFTDERSTATAALDLHRCGILNLSCSESRCECSVQRGPVTACGLYGWVSFRWIIFSDFPPILICRETIRPINPSDFYFRWVDALDNLLRLDYPVAHLRAAPRFRVDCTNVKNPNQHAFSRSLSPPPEDLFSPEFNG